MAAYGPELFLSASSSAHSLQRRESQNRTIATGLPAPTGRDVAPQGTRGRPLGGCVFVLEGDQELLEGLFRCYRFSEGTLQRTNNDLERCFGSVRYGERAAGRERRLRWW